MSDQTSISSRLTRRAVLRSGTAAAALMAIAPGALAQTMPSAQLRLMATTDLHVNVFAYDYLRDAPDDTVGLAKTMTLVRAARAEAKNALVFDNGDFIQGSPLGDYMAYEKGLKPGTTHPMVAAMNAVGYDCGTLGNHEFNYGLDFLAAGLAAARFPFVCANAVKPDGSTLIKPWLILERTIVDDAGASHPIKVGVIGFVPPQIVQWDKSNLDGKLTAIDIVDAAARHVPDLKKAGAEIVVALCHSGIAGGARAGGEENAALHLAKVDGIDAIITGHQHLTFPGHKSFDGIDGIDNKAGTLHGKPAIQPGFWGSHLGLIDLAIVKGPAGWKVDKAKVELRSIYDRVDRKVVPKADADKDVMAAVQADHDATLAYVRRPVSETKAPISSYYALVADDPSVQIVSNAQVWYIRKLVEGTPLAGLPILSAAAPFKAGGRGGPQAYTDIKPGPIAIKNLADIYIFPNTVRVVKVKGAEVREWLERSAGIFNRIDPAKADEQQLIDQSFPSYNFDIIDGVTYKIDVTQASRYDKDGKLAAADAHRIVDLAFNGKPIDDNQDFLIATNNYRAGGGGNFPGANGKTTVIEAPDLNRDVILRYLVELKSVNPTADGNWSFKPWPASANVTFVTGPGGAALKPEGLKLDPAGDGGDGFVKYRLTM